MMNNSRKVMVIGLDCAPPELVFERWRDELPNLRRLIAEGVYGPLKTIVPPITIPAWTCMMTSKDPGQLGFYGFRNRADYSYQELSTANSTFVHEPTVWDIVSRAGRNVILVGVPQTYPPKPTNGCMVSCFLTPSTSSEYTFPPELKSEVETVTDGYILDADGFRTNDREPIRQQVFEMTEKRFRLIRHLMTSRPWDFLMFVEIGVDRIHHAFWKYSDPQHRKYEPGTPYANVILDYYRFVDAQIGELLAMLDDRTVVFVVSDHGARAMDGGFCVNEWLIRQGYLCLEERPDGVVPIGKAQVDWSRTIAWGAGGYYGRLFLNVKGRERCGTVDPKDYEKVREQLKAELEAVTDERGEPLKTRVFKPQEIYRECRNIPPDLIIYFGDLAWRSVGSVGHDAIHVFENDTGPDDANHAEHGIFIMWDPLRRQGVFREDLSIMDCAPTMLTTLGLPVPPDMAGKSIEWR
jgi:predicted AlkP superfamily phosphohydrolase/phosphomutase